MPFRKRVSATRGGKYSKKPSSKKKAVSKYGAAAKTAKRKIASTKRASPGGRAVKKQVVSNAKAIAKLKDAQYGPLQTNYSFMPQISGTGGSIHVTSNYPAALHLNSLYCGQTGEPANKWIQANQQWIGHQTPVMDDYTLVNHPFQPLVPLQHDLSEGQPRPNGEKVLWKSTTLKFQFNAWVPETWVDIYIVQQKGTKELPDPWRTVNNNTHADTYLPYVLPQWRDVGSKPMSGNWIDRKQYNVISHRKLFMDSVAEVPPYGLMHSTADNIMEHVAVNADGGRQAHATKAASSHAVKYCTITIRPNMLMKQLKYDHTDGYDHLNYDANPQETKTVGPWSYDNIDPKQNIWAIVTTSDPGHDGLDPSHAVRFTCHRINTFRDENGLTGSPV